MIQNNIVRKIHDAQVITNRQIQPFDNILRTFRKAKDHVLAGIFKKYLWAFQKSKSEDLSLTEGKLSYKDINNAEMEQVYRYCILRRFEVKQNSCMTVLKWLVLWPVEKMQHKKQHNKQQEAM